MKKMLITLASLGLLVLTSCGTKTQPTTIVPIDNGTPSTQSNTTSTYTTTTPATSSATPYSAPTTGATTTTNTKTTYAAPATITSRTKVVQQPYAGYSSDFRGPYPQMIYDNLATGAYGNIPTYNPPGGYRPPMYNPQPIYPQPSNRFTLYDYMAAYNAQHVK